MQQPPYDTSLVCRSIVLIDELGAATSTSDGIAIAWAVSEHLIAEGRLANSINCGNDTVADKLSTVSGLLCLAKICDAAALTCTN